MSENGNMVSMEILNQIRGNSEKALTELQNGKSAVEVAQQMYMDRLPNKDEEISRLMAEKMNGLVTEFYQNWAAAQDNYAVWCESFLNEQTKDLPLVEACDKLNKMYCMLTMIGAVRGAKSEAEAEEIRAALEQKAQHVFTAEEATEEQFAQLRSKVSEALMDSGIADDQLEELGRVLENASDQLPLVLNFGSRNTDVMTVLAMQAYLDAKDGLYEDVPVDTTMEHIACGVCSTACALEIAAKVESGVITESVACQMMKILGAVAGGFLLFELGRLVGATLFIAFGAIFTPFVGAVVAGVTLFALASTIFIPMVEGGMEVGEFCYYVGAALLRGVKFLAERLREWIKPAVERCKTRVKEAVCNHQGAHVQVTQAETVTE